MNAFTREMLVFVVMVNDARNPPKSADAIGDTATNGATDKRARAIDYMTAVDRIESDEGAIWRREWTK